MQYLRREEVIITIITAKKIIAIFLVLAMMFTFKVDSVYGSEELSIETIYFIQDIFENAVKTMKIVLEIFSETMCSSTSKQNDSVEVSLAEEPMVVKEPIISIKTLAEIAKELKASIRENGYSYQYSVYYNFESYPPSSSTLNKKMNCSAYVSWILYEYAKQKGNTIIENEFKENKSSSGILSYISSDTKNFTYVGELLNLNSEALQIGDIIIKDGHAEY